MATQKALSTTEEQKSMHRATYAEVANRRSEGVCVLDFISEVNSVKGMVGICEVFLVINY